MPVSTDKRYAQTSLSTSKVLQFDMKCYLFEISTNQHPVASQESILKTFTCPYNDSI